MEQLNADIIIGGNSENIGFGGSARSLTEAGYTFGGEITPTSTPDVTEQQLFFVAKTAGTYTNYGNLTVGSGEIAFIYKENGVWKKVSATFATTEQGGLADTAYQKPNSGIPSTDMTEAVQTSLGKADTAIQSLAVGTTTTGEEGTDASVTNSGTPTNPILNFTIPRGDSAVNPFKGWFEAGTTETSNLPANPSVGDYAYVQTVDGEENPVTKVYDCVADGVWHDSGRTIDTSNVQTFETLQQVNEVSIVNDLTTGGVSDVLAAEQGKILKQELTQLDQNLTLFDIKQPLEMLPCSITTYNDAYVWRKPRSYKHSVIPVKQGDIVSHGAGTMYYALLTDYPSLPHENDVPDFVTGYEGRLSSPANGSVTIPAGCNFFVINEPQNHTTITVNGIEVLSGLWEATLSVTDTDNIKNGAVTEQKLNPTFAAGLERTANKKDDLARSNTNASLIAGRTLYEKFLSIEGGISACKMKNLFVTLMRGHVPTTGVVPSTDDEDSTYEFTDYIPVVQEHLYRYILGSSSSVLIIAEYDSSYGFISATSMAGIGGASPKEGVYTPSSTAAYVVLTNNIIINPDGGAFIDITDSVYAFKDDIVVNSLTKEITSNNIANPSDIWNNTIIASNGKVLTKDDDYENCKMEWVDVTPGQTITFGGNDIEGNSYCAFYSIKPSQSRSGDNTNLVGNVISVSRQKLIDGKTVTAPSNAHYLVYTLQFNNKPSSNIRIQANIGNELLQYDEYKEVITEINGNKIGSSELPADLEDRVEAIEDDVADLQDEVADLNNESLIVDLPVSDGTNISVGNAYINSSTGVVTVKLS